ASRVGWPRLLLKQKPGHCLRLNAFTVAAASLHLPFLKASAGLNPGLALCLALDEPENIWEIHPAPADWGTESAVAVAAITATHASVPTKKCGQENCVGYRNFSK